MRAAVLLPVLLPVLFAPGAPGASAAPLPRERPLSAEQLAGAWEYAWNGTPGALHLCADGTLRSWHGEGRCEYLGGWWVDDRGRLILWECRAREGVMIAPPARFEFAVSVADSARGAAPRALTLTTPHLTRVTLERR